MKKFIIRSATFIVTVTLIPIIFLSYLYVTKKYESFVNGFEIYTSIEKSHQKSKKKKLLLGDSVAKQLFMFNHENANINSLACNQAISMVGHYLLFKNYLEADNKIDTAILLININTLKNNLNQIFTFHYFLKPFYNEECKSEFSDNVYKQVKKIPFHNASQFPLIKASNWSPNFKSEDSSIRTFLSPISREYLLKMKELAQKNNITFLIYPAPLRKSVKKKVESMPVTSFNTAGLEKEFSLYFTKLKYIDDEYFVDRLHFKRSFLRAHSNFLNEILY